MEDVAAGSTAHPEIHPERTLWLLSVAHAVNHAQAVLLPLVYLQVLSEFQITLGDVATLAAVGAFASGIVQLSFAKLTRVVSRRVLLGSGGGFFSGGGWGQGARPPLSSLAPP